MVFAVTLALAGALFLLDFQNVLSWRRRHVVKPSPWFWSNDFTIVIPLYGHPRYFDDREKLVHYQSRVLVAMDVRTRLMQEFAFHLEQEGWRVFRTVIADATVEAPGPPSLLLAALDAGAITTSYVVRMDADTSIVGDLAGGIRALERDGADLASVKVLVRNRRSSFVTRLQGLEYDMAMLSRHYRPWLASGACFVAKRGALHAILRRHTMSYLGEDVETGRIATALRMRVRHLDIVVETDAPETWRGLFRQRRIWWAGNFRHAVLNADRNALHTPWWALYYVGLVWVGLYFKSSSIDLIRHHALEFVAAFPCSSSCTPASASCRTCRFAPS